MTKEATYKLTLKQVEMIHAQIKDHCSALKNWAASQIEAGNLDKAQELVRELRQYEMLYSELNPLGFERRIVTPTPNPN